MISLFWVSVVQAEFFVVSRLFKDFVCFHWVLLFVFRVFGFLLVGSSEIYF